MFIKWCPWSLIFNKNFIKNLFFLEVRNWVKIFKKCIFISAKTEICTHLRHQRTYIEYILGYITMTVDLYSSAHSCVHHYMITIIRMDKTGVILIDNSCIKRTRTTHSFWQSTIYISHVTSHNAKRYWSDQKGYLFDLISKRINLWKIGPCTCELSMWYLVLSVQCPVPSAQRLVFSIIPSLRVLYWTQGTGPSQLFFLLNSTGMV